jgi:hypothetical protein
MIPVLLIVLTSCFSASSEFSCQNNIVGKEGRVIKKIISGYNYQPGDSCFGGMSEFDKLGRLTTEYDFSSCGKLFKKVTYHYDKTGKVQSSSITSKIENVTYKWNYNEKGLVTEKVATQPTKSFQYKLSYRYDAEGNQIEYKGTMADGSAFRGTSREEYVYENGLKMITRCFGGNEFDIPGYRTEHFYDNTGKEIKSLVYKDPSSTKADMVYLHYQYH